MNDLHTIVERNREAVRQGNAKAGELIGTKNSKPKLYDVVDVSSLTVVLAGVTIAECGAYRQAIADGTAELVEV